MVLTRDFSRRSITLPGNLHPSTPKELTPEEEKKLHRTPSYWQLFDAISDGDQELVQAVLQGTADAGALLAKKDLQGLTPLRKAIALGNADIARILVSWGAKPNITDPRGRTTLHLAAMQGKRELVAPLLVSTGSDVNTQDITGMTPLHYAIRGKHEKVIDWLLFVGANVNLKNKDDESPVDMCKPDYPFYEKVVSNKRRDMERYPVNLASAFIERKKLCDIESDGSLMFVTTDQWSEEPRFILCSRIRIADLNPRIPLGRDEVFMGEGYHYRMMQRLEDGMNRVKVYFTVFHDFIDTCLTLKVTSKAKYIGQISMKMSTFVHLNYTNYMAYCELDLLDEGQFVLCKAVKKHALVKGHENIHHVNLHPNFFIEISDNTFPAPPDDWNGNREKRAKKEVELLLQRMPSLMRTSDSDPDVVRDSDEDAGNEEANNNNKNQNRGKEEEHPDTNSEDSASQSRRIKPGDLLDGDEEDTCETFYYISRGWAPWIEVRKSCNPNFMFTADHLALSPRRCNTPFYQIFHPCGLHMYDSCYYQIPKTKDFIKTGTVLVFVRKDLKKGEEEDPDPDDLGEEYLLSDDGVNTKGQVWLTKEKERWELIKGGICNKQTRVIFKAAKTNPYIVIQLNHGTETWEKEFPGDSESDDESGSEEYEDEGSEGDEGSEKKPKVDEEGEEPESGEEVKKKKKKKKKKASEPNLQEEEEGVKKTKSGVKKDSNASNANDPLNKNNSYTIGDDELNELLNSQLARVAQTMEVGPVPMKQSFANLQDEAISQEAPDPEGVESVEEIPQADPRKSIIRDFVDGESIFDGVSLGPSLKTSGMSDEELDHLKLEIAAMWRYRNHNDTYLIVCSKQVAPGSFSLIFEIATVNDLPVRAEYWWSVGYKQVARSVMFPTKTGRMFSIAMEGNVLVDSPPGSSPGFIKTADIFYTAVRVCYVEYKMRRPPQEDKGSTGGGKKKKKEPEKEPEWDFTLELLAYPLGPGISSAGEICTFQVNMNGPDLWLEEHIQMRAADAPVLQNIVQILKKDEEFVQVWWKLWLMLGYSDNEVEIEKPKDWSTVVVKLLDRLFLDNINDKDRGVIKLMRVMNHLNLEVAMGEIIRVLSEYKTDVFLDKSPPRMQNLFVNWIRRSKITRHAIINQYQGTDVIQPVSNLFLLLMSFLLVDADFTEVGHLMEVEDNVLYSISAEECILDPSYQYFRIMIKSRQKKDEMVHYTLLLMEMTRTLELQEAQDFVVNETRKWMMTVADKEPDLCSKLENLFPQNTRI